MKSNRASKITLALLATALHTQALAAASEVRSEFHQTYPLAKNGTVRLDNVNGSIRILTWDRDEVKVDAVKRAKKQEHLDEVQIEVENQAGRIGIKTKYPEPKSKRSQNSSVSVDYTLTVPKESHLGQINNVNGGVAIENVRGDIKARSVNGQVNASGLAGSVDLSTVNGAVKARFDAFAKPALLKSVNGGLTVALPADTGAVVSAKTLHGNIESDFSIQAKKRFPLGQNLDGQLGSGGPSIELSSVNGGIQLRRTP